MTFGKSFFSSLSLLGTLFILLFLYTGCSDFYSKKFVHIASIQHLSDEQQIQKELEIQAMRKSQIMQDNQSRLVMIVRYVNEYSSELADELNEFAIALDKDKTKKYSKKGEIFLVELYDKHDEIAPEALTFRLKSSFDSIESTHIHKLSPKELAQSAYYKPDIAYNDVYLVRFESIGMRGREALKLEGRVKNLGSMSFDFGFVVRRSKLMTQ